MDHITLINILIVIAIGTYFQTLTGFGLGIIVIGLTISLELIPLNSIAIVVSIVTLFNCFTALIGKKFFNKIKVIFLFLLLGIVPGIILGVYFLNELTERSTNILRGFLGGIILIASINFMFKPNENEIRSSYLSFLFSGFMSGITAGLFGMAGPPIIYHLYRQPMSLDIIRSILLMVFATTSAFRTLYVFIEGSITYDIFVLSMIAIPLVTIVTILARHFPPSLSIKQFRRLIFFMLMMIGVYLIFSALLSFFKH